MPRKKNILAFGIVSAIYLLLILFQFENLAWYLKPFLVLFLLLEVFHFDLFPSKKWLLLGLFFSWLGDIVLMFSDIAEIYFILGLLLFLTAHIFYIILFAKQNAVVMHKTKITYWIGFSVVLLYLFGMLSILFPKTEALKFPIGIYASAISLMLLEALKGFFNWQQSSKKWVLAGALFFVLSDSLLAINKFYIPLPYASLSVMATYILAQYSIVYGILSLNKSVQS